MMTHAFDEKWINRVVVDDVRSVDMNTELILDVTPLAPEE
jgi:hypothetical protein